MKRNSTATEHAATKDKSAKRGRASGTATEHATSGNAREHAALASDIEDSHGPATEQKRYRFQVERASDSLAKKEVACTAEHSMSMCAVWSWWREH